MAMLNNQRVTQAVTQACQIVVGYWEISTSQRLLFNQPIESAKLKHALKFIASWLLHQIDR